LAIDTVYAFDSLATVYNFEVAERHNYFVGREGVLVHNSYAESLSASEMRSLVGDWASEYQQSLPSITQKDKFSKACVARWRNAPLVREDIFFGRNGGILNTQASYPTISAEKKLSIHHELADRLPETTKWPNQANCAECDAVNQALWEGALWDEIQIHTIDIRPNGTMSDVIQCSECLDIFSDMYVTSQ